MYQKLKNKQNILFYLILLTFINSINSSSSSDSDEHSLSSSSSRNSKLSSTNVEAAVDSDEVLPKKLFAHYRESYITREDAKKFRQRVQAHKTPYTDGDYDDLIHEMDFKPKKSKKVAADIYDKKYFDYLPAEDDSDSENERHAKKSSSKKHHSKHPKHHHHNKQLRYRRDTLALDDKETSAGADKNVAKRQTHFTGYYYPVPANPWTDGYYQSHRPVVNPNFLSVAPVYIVPQLQPFGEYPSNVPHHNIAHPPVNPPTTSQIVTESPMDLINRFDDDEDRPVWEMWDANSPNSIQIVNPQRPQPTRRPPPPILRVTTQATETGKTRRPAPSIIRNPIKTVDDSKAPASALNSVQSSSNTNRGPELGPAFQSDNQPRPIQSMDEQQGAGPSRCVWGIVTCCKRGNLALRYNCFENLGCGGAFWDYNPCSDDILDKALEQTNKFFD